MSDHKNIVEFTTRLRKIEGLRLFRIFTKYTSLIDIQNVFNCLGKCETEEVLRELECMWKAFMEEKNNDKQD